MPHCIAYCRGGPGSTVNGIWPTLISSIRSLSRAQRGIRPSLAWRNVIRYQNVKRTHSPECSPGSIKGSKKPRNYGAFTDAGGDGGIIRVCKPRHGTLLRLTTFDRVLVCGLTPEWARSHTTPRPLSREIGVIPFMPTAPTQRTRLGPEAVCRRSKTHRVRR